MPILQRVIAFFILFAVQGCQAPHMSAVDPDTVSRLQEIVLPEVEFKETDICNVLEFFHLCSLPIGYKPPPMRQDVRQTEVVYFLPVPEYDDPHVAHPGIQQEGGEKKFYATGHLITLSANGISLLELLQRVAIAAKGTMIVKPDLVIIRVPLSPAGGESVKRQVQTKQQDAPKESK